MIRVIGVTSLARVVTLSLNNQSSVHFVDIVVKLVGVLVEGRD
jgi:hypothetical protein